MLKLNKFTELSRKKKILLGLLLVFVMFLTWLIIRVVTLDTKINVVNLYQTPELVSLNDLYTLEEGDYSVAIDGKVVTGKNFEEDDVEVLPTASTAKMILGLAVMREKPFELGEDGEILTISEDDYNRYVWYSNHNGSNTPVQVGEEISEYDALISVFLASSNNLAETLAIYVFGSIDNYREYAENMLKEMGIENTTIGENITGYDDSTTSTTEDLAKIGDYVLRQPVLREIVGTREKEVPVAGLLKNTNTLLGTNNIIGIKTGYNGIYNLVSGYSEKEHNITVALLGAKTRNASFDYSLDIVRNLQERLKVQPVVSNGQTLGYLESWWMGSVKIFATEDLEEIVWQDAEINSELSFEDESGEFKLKINDNEYKVAVSSDNYNKEPSFIERIMHVFGWEKEKTEINFTPIENETGENIVDESQEETVEEEKPSEEKSENKTEKFTNATSSNCTIELGALMLINPNFPVENSFIAKRKTELVSISSKYGIVEGNAGNGDNLLDAEAAVHINDMVNAYKAAYPGHTLETRSCFRSVGTNCGRLCAATGQSDHHTGLTCDLLDPAYGDSLDTDTYNQHIDWQWLRANSYKYGFIDRFPEAWAGGLMSEPLNVDENGSTGLFETWHYRYVGVGPATEIATGKYNNGQYDSLEHYLKARGLVNNLKAGTCK